MTSLCIKLSRKGALILSVVTLILVPTFAAAGSDEESRNITAVQVREEFWGIPSTIPMLAYVIRPVGNGPFPLLVMNHGVSLDPKERSYFPVIEFRDAALWFAKQGYVVVAPVRLRPSPLRGDANPCK